MQNKLKQIKLLLLDVDGVMTDGGIIYDGHGVETKRFNVKDGHGIKMLQRYGIEVGIITGRTSIVVDNRAKELGISIVHQGALKKIEHYQTIKEATGLQDHQIAYMGDDIIDVPVLKRVGFSAAPADAVDDVLSRVDYISKLNGGAGAVRDLCDHILKACGFWDDVVSRYDL